MEKVIILLGPTGVGKTAASILLAKRLNTEIISSDSMQIYKHMDIGTAKPTIEERETVKHHMIDIVEPWETYSTGEYIKAVRPIIESLHEQKKIPVIVGGTGLYIKAMTRGIFSGPSADWDLRNELLEKEKESPGYLHEYLKSLDPKAASKIMPADTRRIVRALEVCLKSDMAMSEIHKTLTIPLPYEFVKIGITRDRKELYRIIEQRVDKMIEDGLIDEVKNVIQMIKENGYRQEAIGHKEDESLPIAHRLSPIAYSSMQAIGYKEIAMHLNGEISLDEAIALVKKRSRNYAKRQFTWFKKEEEIQWIDATGIYEPDEIFKKVIQFIHA
ncbi:MAG: tRNA (adenosine(37)-N6)-dimethylallyltransferase MiaA [Nitrospirae bacterium]|nr:tRNA (adenosine(37)-N6)-dimethylallyltransferase MiaA [Nitrospirota bacterium]MCL5977732.1 tRNA (adenosine(37)-N6)-dimethylallyltransferase MiaA [Nitrospirota bacterium]